MGAGGDGMVRRMTQTPGADAEAGVRRLTARLEDLVTLRVELTSQVIVERHDRGLAISNDAGATCAATLVAALLTGGDAGGVTVEGWAGAAAQLPVP